MKIKSRGLRGTALVHISGTTDLDAQSALLAGFGAFVVLLILIAFVPAFLSVRKNLNSAIGPGT